MRRRKQTKTLSAPWLSPLLLPPLVTQPLKMQPAFERRRGAGGRPQSAAAPGPGAPLMFVWAGGRPPLSLPLSHPSHQPRRRRLQAAVPPHQVGLCAALVLQGGVQDLGKKRGGRRGGVNLAGGPPPPALCPLLSPAVTRPTRPSWRLISAKGGAGWEGGSVHGRRRLPSVFRCFSACSPRRQSPLRPSPVSL